MNDMTDAPVRTRQRLAGLLPPSVRRVVLAAWRPFYWWSTEKLAPARGKRTARALVASGKPIKLEVGGGPRAGLEDWTSLDLASGAAIPHDLTTPLPFPDGSVDEIYSSHVLEHFTYPEPALGVLRECRRVLKDGGRFRIAVPNARIFLDAYFNPDNFDREKFCTMDVGLKFRSRIDAVNFIAYLGGEHKFMYDADNLPLVLEEAGFRNIRARSYDPSIDLAARVHESIYAEAVK